MDKINKLSMLPLILAAVCVICRPAKAETSIYVFDTSQSTVTQTGGFAGVHETYNVTGQYRLSVDSDADVALFETVDANLADETGAVYSQSLDEIFNMTGVTGTIIDEMTIQFEGKTADGTESDVRLKLSLSDGSARLTGNTTPPPNTADMFLYDVNAVAIRKYTGGTGEPNDPYQIATAENLMLLGETTEDYDKHFILTADIDLDPNLPGRKVFDRAVIAPYLPAMGSSGQPRASTITRVNAQDLGPKSSQDSDIAFSGTFNGQGHRIVNMNIYVDKRAYLGLFGSLAEGAVLFDLCLENLNIISTNCSAGALVGENSGTISNCYSTGSINGDYDIGGLVGFNLRTVENCYSTVSIDGAGDRVGGLVGFNNAIVSNSYSAGSVSGHVQVGGLIGYNNSIVTDCYSIGTVIGDEQVGGLIGANAGTVSNCHSKGAVVGYNQAGGLIGEERFGNIVINSFWDIQESNQTESKGGIGLTSDQMQNSDTFQIAGWDFVEEWNNGVSEIWQITPDKGYPTLAFFDGYDPLDLQGSGTVEDPYLITSVQELGSIRYQSWAHYHLLNSINFSDIHLTNPLVNSFSGTFDGGGHAISDLTIAGAGYIGLFGRLETKAEIRDLIVDDVNIISFGEYTGALLGINSGMVSKCCSTGFIFSNGRWTGGLIANNYGLVLNCYSIVSVEASSHRGGLIGQNAGTISNCYSISPVDGAGSRGGLVGSPTRVGMVLYSFWENQTSDQFPSAAGIGLSTAEMQTASTFLYAGWDFAGETDNGTEDIWSICEGTNYPRFVWQIPLGDFVCPDGVTIEDFAFFMEHWLDDNCDLSNDYCEGTDLDQSGTVDVLDLEIFFENWPDKN